jgi:hypothetical protein
MFDFGIKAALESYGTWGIYLRHCGRTRFDLYPGYAFSRHYIARVKAAIARPAPDPGPRSCRGFRKGSGVYSCKCCGKLTRETGSCESNVHLCLACYDDAGWENQHSDEAHDETGKVAGCPYCAS